MGLETATLLTIGSTLVSTAATVGGSIMSASAQSASAERQQAEIYRQQVAARKQQAEAKSDRMRQANIELGRVRASELGSAATKQRVGMELGYVTGTDIGRINTSYDSRIQGLQSQSVVAGEQAGQAWSSALWTSAASVVGGGLGAYTQFGQSQALAAERAASLSTAQRTNELLSNMGGGLSLAGTIY